MVSWGQCYIILAARDQRYASSCYNNSNSKPEGIKSEEPFQRCYGSIKNVIVWALAFLHKSIVIAEVSAIRSWWSQCKIVENLSPTYLFQVLCKFSRVIYALVLMKTSRLSDLPTFIILYPKVHLSTKSRSEGHALPYNLYLFIIAYA